MDPKAPGKSTILQPKIEFVKATNFDISLGNIFWLSVFVHLVMCLLCPVDLTISISREQNFAKHLVRETFGSGVGGC